MSDHTGISWTDHTFNPWMGCTKVSDGCKHCYAEDLIVRRFRFDVWGPKAPRRRTSAANWRKPLAWNRAAERRGVPAMVFSGSLCDVFEDRPGVRALRLQLWDLIRATPWLVWQILTKRPENIARLLPDSWAVAPWPNVWLGTSVEDMRVARRVEALRAVPAACRFLSYEPALGPLEDLNLVGIHWLIYGGESGPHFRPDNPDWARSIRDQCRANGVAFFYKQGAARRPQAVPMLDGRVHHAWPIGWWTPRPAGLRRAPAPDSNHP